MEIVNMIVAALLGYLAGSVNSSILVSKFYATDIRKHGSGNAGLTNTLRTLGKIAALLVLVGDILKGVVACLLGSVLAGVNGMFIGGLAAVIGHNWPLYFKFLGGKGVLTSITVVMFMDWEIGVTALLIFAVVVGLTRYVSLGSIIGAALLPLLAILFNKDMVFVLFSAILALLVIFRHKTNILRLIKGNESKLGQKK